MAIQPMSSTAKALNIVIIVDEIIWLSHAGSCNDCRNPLRLDLGHCYYSVDHKRALSRHILVCELWAKIGIAQLWGSYAEARNLLSIMNNVHQRDKHRNVDSRRESESSMDTDVRDSNITLPSPNIKAVSSR
jgi:hypothetical protein